MNAKKFNMTEEELQQYCDSLHPAELQRFQLESKMADIKNAKNTLKFFLINIAFCLASMYFAFDKKEIIVLVIAGVVLLLSILFAFGFAQRIKQEKLMYRMLEIWFNENL